MDDKLYEQMDWPNIEAIIYGEHAAPHDVLGAHKTPHGVRVSTYQPMAAKVSVHMDKTGKAYPMEKVDEAGYFAALLPIKRMPVYHYKVEDESGATKEIKDPYAYAPFIDARDVKRFGDGIHYNIYEKLGAHVLTRDGVTGTLFAVWAPNAWAVGVACDSNNWKGSTHLMRRLGDSGIFELFIPGIREGELYKYELHGSGGSITLKSDPYGNYAELRPATASKVYDLSRYEWSDAKWLKERAQKDATRLPLSIYEVHLGSWKKPTQNVSESDEPGFDDSVVSSSSPPESRTVGGEFYNYRVLADELVEYLKEMEYTHVELMPIMEHPLDLSWGYQVTGYYAPTSRHGTPDDFKYFIDVMHRNGIGVILDWVPAHFPKDAHGLAAYDGTCLYEHLDPRQGTHPHWGTLIYNYGRPQVANFLIANALFWVEEYHVDGIRMDAVASMLYLDYGKSDGEWVANLYGGNENLEAVEMLQRLNAVMAKRNKGVMVIAEESTSWPMITGDAKENGLGFQYKWNMGWMNDFLDYMRTDPLFRKGRHGALTFSMVYHYSEKFILVLSHDEVVHGKGSMIGKMPGEYGQKFANLRVAYGFMMTHPGKKLLFMGQEFAQFDEWDEKRELDWQLVEDFEAHRQMRDYVKAWNIFYQRHPALYELDYDVEGFEWLSSMDADHGVITFMRRSENAAEQLLVVCNFTPVAYSNFRVGVPFAGKYKELFNSDQEVYGGEGNVNPRVKQSKGVRWDGRDNSIIVTVPPLGTSVFLCTVKEG